jgi:small-conductance mechanosensitive channel
LIFQEPPQPQPPSFGQTVIEKILYYVNYNFINQAQFKVSLLSLILLGVVLLIALMFSRLARRFLEKRVLVKFHHMDRGLQFTLLRVIHYVIVTIGLLYAVKVGFSIDITSVAVILGFLSVGIGFGLQYIAADIVSGFILLFERPVRVGDRLKLDDGMEGRVERIRMRSTILITNENMAVIMPNSKLVQERFINYSFGSQNVRLNIPVGVAYGSDLEAVKTALLEAAGGVEEVLDEPPPRVHFSSFGESSLDFEIRIWINLPHNHPQIRSKVNFEIDRAFRKYNIEIPFPQRDVHIKAKDEG